MQDSSPEADTLLAAAHGWAAGLGSSSVDVDHLGLAIADGERCLAAEIGLDGREWLAQSVMWLGFQRGAAAMTPRPPSRDTPLLRSAELVRVVATAASEAARNGHPTVDARHLLVALLAVDSSTVATHARVLGASAADARVVLKFLPYRRPYADSHSPDVGRRPSSPTVILLGGGDMSRALPEAVAEARRLRRRSSTGLAVGVVGATNSNGGRRFAERLRRQGVNAIDTGVDCRESALTTDVVPDCDVIYVPGGDPAAGYDALWATPFYEALVDFADGGGIVMGHSAGATIWGSGHQSSFVSQGDEEQLPMFGWLGRTVVVAHHLENGVRLNTARRHFPDRIILAVAHEGAVVAVGGSVRLLTPGDADSIIFDPTTGTPRPVATDPLPVC